MDKSKKSVYESIITIDPTIRVGDSVAWFNSKIPEILSGTIITQVMTGKMYTFAYDPVTKESLPFWDKYPLIFVLEKRKRNIVGINLHYIPPKIRLRIFEMMLPRATTKVLVDKTRMTGLTNFIKTIPGHQYMIKQYCPEGMRSKLLEIPGNEWGKAIAMPLAGWKIGNPESNKMGPVELSMLKHTITHTRDMIKVSRNNLG